MSSDERFEKLAEEMARGEHRRGAFGALLLAGGPFAGMVVGGTTGSVGYGIATTGAVWLLGLIAAVTRAMGA